MPDRWVPRGADDFTRVIIGELPTGDAWPRDPDGDLMRWCAGSGQVWGDVSDRAAALLVTESDPRATLEMLPDWERAFGLPDPCVAEPLTITDRRKALVTNPLNAQLVFNGAASSLASAFPFQMSVAGAAASVVNPFPVLNSIGGAAVGPTNPMPASNPSVAPQRSAALETCHTFTKASAGSAMRSVAVSGQSASALWLFLMDLSAAPSSATSQAASVLLAPLKMGSDGSSFQGAADFSGAPLPSTNGLVACLSTTAYPTYTAAGAIGAFTGQVQ